jgi:hypothetical protein
MLYIPGLGGSSFPGGLAGVPGPAGANGSDGPAGSSGLTLVGRDAVLSGTKTKLQITGLDGVNYRYKVFWHVQNSGSAATAKFSFNDELTDTGYNGRTAAGTQVTNNAAITQSLSTGFSVPGVFDIFQTNLSSGTSYYWVCCSSGSTMVLDRKSWDKVPGSLTNIVSFEIYNMTFAVSSFLEIYRYG